MHGEKEIPVLFEKADGVYVKVKDKSTEKDGGENSVK